MFNRSVWFIRILGIQLLIAGGATALQASAADSIALGGAEAGADNSYLYAGVVRPLQGSTLGNGVVQRYWVDRTTYRYDGSNGKIDAEAWGVEGALGYQGSHDQTWWGAYAALVYRDTHLSPDDPTSKARGEKFRGKVQVEGETPLSASWRINGNASYVFGQQNYWVRGRLLYRLSGTLSTGPEVLTQGDPDYKISQVGWVVTGLRPTPDLDLGLKLGAKKARGESTQAYLGIELSHSF